MKAISLALVSFGLFLLGLSVDIHADTIVMATGQTVEGIALQTNDDDVLVLTKFAAFNYSKTSIKEITPATDEPSTATVGARLPNFHDTILLLSKELWATNLTPIPATVVDKGVLRNVPYSSFHCGADYEVNVYGDPENPAGIEIGVYRKLLGDAGAKSNCLQFIDGILRDASDKQCLHMLNLDKDIATHDGLTIEVTPPTDEDAYNGWWISVYSVKQLDLARASDDEMRLISMTRADAEKNARESTNEALWSSGDLRHARQPSVETFSFRNSDGVMIKDAEVVRIIDGVNLIWRKGSTTSGMVKLEDLSDDLRTRFGYDPVKSKAADDLDASNKARWQQQANATAVANQTVASDSLLPDLSSYGDGSSYSGDGRVYVHGYYRSNGTYVNSYTRSYPRR